MATTEGGNTARQAQRTPADTMNTASRAEGAGRPDEHITKRLRLDSLLTRSQALTAAAAAT